MNVVALLPVLVTLACAGALDRVMTAPSPHERYGAALRDANLDGTALGADWLRAGDAALAQPLSVTLPFREAGYFPADTPTATAYRFELTRGRIFQVELTFDGVEATQLFVDLFEARPDEPPARVASLSEGNVLSHEVRRDGTYLLRVQPELLRSGRYTIVERTLASLMFPVQGLTATAIQSEFGAARDAGRREHEGIDIFAARHTPVVAVADGRAATGTNNLGGNVVWLRDARSSRSFYYAHLSRWAFEGTSTVRTGDVVGYVGNTGNARTTAPHLHFGIYERGAIDPFPFLRADDPVPPAPAGAEQWLAELVRVTSARAALRRGTGRDATVAAQLNRASLGRVLGATGSQLRIEFPDGSSGYIDRTAVTRATTALRRQQLSVGTALRDQPAADAPTIATVAEPMAVEVIGEFNGFAFVRPATGRPGWVHGK